MPGAAAVRRDHRWLSDNLPEDAIVTNGAGNFAGWLHRHFRYKGFRTQLGPTNGSMGYGVPAAVAAKIAEPKRTVLALCRRRRLPDDRPGDRHRGAVRRERSSCWW